VTERLTVFVRSGCHLCEQMLQELQRLRSEDALGRDFQLEVVDILGSESLEAEYGTRIPVLSGERGEICYYFLDETALRQYFGLV